MEKEYLDFNDFYNLITSLATQQGFYARLLENIDDLEENELEELKQEIEKQKFKDKLDIVLWLES